MPLTRDRILGHDNERLAFRFTMLNHGETVECQISDAAMDELAEHQRNGKHGQGRRNSWRCGMPSEGIASAICSDRVPVVKGRVIRIFNKHIQKPPSSLAGPIATGSELDTDNTVSLRVIAETRPASAAQ